MILVDEIKNVEGPSARFDFQLSPINHQEYGEEIPQTPINKKKMLINIEDHLFFPVFSSYYLNLK